MMVVEIVKEYLKANGFDGLYAPGECACKVDDLMPCCEDSQQCEAGYLQECSEDCGEHSWHIGKDKPKDKKDGE